MPLWIDGEISNVPLSVVDFIQTYPQFQIRSTQLKSMPVITVDPQEPYLFVHQMESGCISADDPEISMIGIDDMTTCCSLIIRHNGSKALAAGHFDGNDTKGGFQSMIRWVITLTENWAEKNHTTHLLNELHYEVFLVGGFEDARNISLDVITQLLEILYEYPMDLHLRQACIYTNNTCYRDNIPFPCITGLVCDARSGCISPASFSFQGPLEEVRRLRFAMRPPIIMHSVYNPFTRILEISPYDWTLTNDTIQQLLGLNTNSFLHYWSTSPLAEKPTFVPSCKTALKFLKDNRESLFRSGRPYRFARMFNRWQQAG